MTTMTEQATQAFEVGDGATVVMWSDAHAGTIIEASAKTVTWQRDKATLLNGVESGAEDALTFSPGGFCGHTSGVQRYSYAADENGETQTFTLRKNGKWILAGQAMKNGRRLVAGRREHYDFNF
jgi:hypothetical protein